MVQPYPLPRQTRETTILSGDGGATYGPFDFKIFDPEDVAVLLRMEEDGAFEPTVAFTATKTTADALSFFTVTFDENVPDTTDFIVRAARVHERSIGVSKGSGIGLDALEREFSKLATVLQELRRDNDQAFRLPPGVGQPLIAAPQEGRVATWDLSETGKAVLRPGPSEDEIAEAGEHAASALASLNTLLGASTAFTRTLLTAADQLAFRSTLGIAGDVFQSDLLSGVTRDVTARAEAGVARFLLKGEDGAPVGAVRWSASTGQVVIGSFNDAGEAFNASIGIEDGFIFVNGRSVTYDGALVLGGTEGGGQKAVGSLTSVNGLQFGVPDVAVDPSVLSTYASRDAVADFTFIQGNQNVLDVPDLGTTYGADYVQNAVIEEGLSCRPGQIIDTDHSPKWSGVITSVDDALNRAYVSAWYRVDGSSTTGTPAAGTGCTINGTTKLFGHNTAVWFGVGESPDVDGHGHELDMVFWKAGLGFYYGFDAVIYGDHQPERVYAHSARWGGATARFDGGYYSEDTLDEGAFHALWRAGEDYVRPLVRSTVGGTVLYSVTAAGKASSDKVAYASSAVSATIPADCAVFICTNAAGTIDATLPSATDVNDGLRVRVVTLGAGGANVKKPGGTTINTLATGEYQDVIASNNDWQPIGAGSVV